VRRRYNGLPARECSPRRLHPKTAVQTLRGMRRAIQNGKRPHLRDRSGSRDFNGRPPPQAHDAGCAASWPAVRGRRSTGRKPALVTE